VSVSWRIEDAAEGAEIVLDWRESGGPQISEPTRRSFGTRLIRAGLVGSGGVEKSYPPTGFIAKFRAAMSAIQAV